MDEQNTNQPSVEPSEPTTKPADPGSVEPSEPTTKPADPGSAGQSDPTTKPGGQLGPTHDPDPNYVPPE